MNRVKGFILLEVLIAILLLEIGLIGSIELFTVSIASAYNSEQALQALQILRGEIEKIEQMDFSQIKTRTAWLKGFFFVQSVQNLDEDRDWIIDCKKVQGRIVWKDFYSTQREFILITYRSNT